jgi:hypothetical protein
MGMYEVVMIVIYVVGGTTIVAASVVGAWALLVGDIERYEKTLFVSFSMIFLLLLVEVTRAWVMAIL